MSVTAYPAYRDSGVDWLGLVPSHWKAVPLKRAIRFTTGWTPPTDRDDLYDGNHAWATIRDMSGKEINDTAKSISDEAIRLAGINPTPQGSLLFSFKLSIGQVCFAGRDMYTNEAIATFLPGGEVQLNFAYYAFPLFVTAKAAENIYGAKLLNQELIQNAALVLPPPDEQSAIANFLDHETAKIDALVEEQERLMALLKEKRQAVVSQAVTKGLDPNAPMKDSGLAWLGAVPAHWKSVQLGRLCRSVSDGPHFSPSYLDDGIMFLSARNIRVDGWSLEDAKFISEADYAEFSRRVIPERGDVLYTKGGTTGIAKVVDLDRRFQVWVHVAILKLRQEVVCPNYLAYALNSTGCYEQSQLHTRGATNQDLGLTRMVRIWLALPPLAEQRLVVGELESFTRNIDTLTSEATRAIALLRERRAALISAAVTGKIDVRHLAPAAQAAA